MSNIYSTNTQESILRELGPYRIFLTGIDIPLIEFSKPICYGTMPIVKEIKYDDFVVEDLLNKTFEAYETMLASEDVLRRDWDSPEEDAAWENL
ncbi:MAG: hypothetical protein DYG95_22340 [Chlorobi bacterium CHB1]|nr:hypothetical protein [Chlorobi bacterium CHB1]